MKNSGWVYEEKEMLTAHAIPTVRNLSVSSDIRVGKGVHQVNHSRSTVGMNRVAICPPMPVV